MTITAASALIAAAFNAGLIDGETAARAQDAIRARSYYGNAMTATDRARIVRVRFGIEG
jgi:hypothetical protein